MRQEKIIIPFFLFFISFSHLLQARDSRFTQKETGPMYWIAYEYCIDNNIAIPEDRWKKNIDWMAANFKDYGYDMICTDGWIEVAQTINPNGYITKYNSAWANDFSYWNNYIKNKGMKAGVYYNPLWMTRTAHSQNCSIVNSNVHAQNISGDYWFNSELAWVDVDKEGAEQWIKGYVRHFINLGFTYLRIDFLENYENNYGTRKYEKALRWMKEEAGDEIFLSLVMPNCYNHAEVELRHGDMIRISDDCYGGGWDFVSNRKRGTVNNKWPQYWNAFDGFIAFSDIAAKGQMIMDGDFMRINTMANKAEKQFLFSLMCITGSALAIADQYDTVGDDVWIYQNEELIALNRLGFVAKPISDNIHDKQNSSRWVGKLPNGDWIIGLFNREDSPVRYSINFEKELGIKDGKVYNVRDLWEHHDLGSMSEKYSTILDPHSCKIIRITPDFEKNIYMLGAAVNAWDSNNPVMMRATDDSNTFIYELDLNSSTENKLLKFSLNIDNWQDVYYLVPEQVESGLGYAYLKEGINKMKKCSRLTGDLTDHFFGIRESENGRYRLVVDYKNLTLDVNRINANQHYQNVYMLGEAVNNWDSNSPISMLPTVNRDIFSYELNLNSSSENKLIKFSLNTGNWQDVYYLVPEQVESGQSYAYLKEGINKMKICSQQTGNLTDHFFGIRVQNNGKYKLTVNPVAQTLNVELIGQKEHYENIYILGEAVNAWNSNNPIYMFPSENQDVFTYNLDLNYSSENKLFKFSVNVGDWDEVYYLIPEQVEPGQSYAYLKEGKNRMKICSQLTGDLADHFWGIKEGEYGKYTLTVDPINLTLDAVKNISTAMKGNNTLSFKCLTTYNTISVSSDKTANIELYNLLSGNLIAKRKSVKYAEFRDLSAGIYLVKVNDQTMKVIVK